MQVNIVVHDAMSAAPVTAGSLERSSAGVNCRPVDWMKLGTCVVMPHVETDKADDDCPLPVDHWRDGPVLVVGRSAAILQIAAVLLTTMDVVSESFPEAAIEAVAHVFRVDFGVDPRLVVL